MLEAQLCLHKLVQHDGRGGALSTPIDACSPIADT